MGDGSRVGRVVGKQFGLSMKAGCLIYILGSFLMLSVYPGKASVLSTRGVGGIHS